MNFGYINIKGGDDELFYTLQYLNNTKYDKLGNNKYFPLADRIYTLKQIEEGTAIGLIPMKPKNEFKFLTYEVFPIIGNISLSIYECDNYPLCHLNYLNEINNDKLKKIENYKSYYYTYNKDEWDNDISPISKRQKMLLISCDKGIDLNDSKKVIFEVQL